MGNKNNPERENAPFREGANGWNVMKTDDVLPGTVQIGRTLTGMVPREQVRNLVAWLYIQAELTQAEVDAEVRAGRAWLLERMKRAGGGAT